MGHLSITPNSKLKDLTENGIKYGEPGKVNWNKNTTLTLEPVNNFASQKAKRAMAEISALPVSP